MEITSYIAGFIDGEGYLGIRKHTTKACKEGFHHHICVKVAQIEQNRKPLDMLQERYGGHISKPRMGGNRRPTLMWELVNTKLVKKLLEELTPLLIIKQPQAKLLQEFIAAGKITTRIPDKIKGQREDIYQKREALYQRGLQMNRRGLAETE